MRSTFILGIWVLILAQAGRAQATNCVRESPERRGEPGCSIIENRRLSGSLSDGVYWHVDAFERLDDAKRAAGPNGVAFTAHGRAWLTTIENDTSAHRAGQHRVWVGPIPVQPHRAYAMQVMSAYFVPGQRSRVHTHTGPEAWYVVAGEQCLETTTRVIRASAGEGAIVAEGDTMRLVATGTAARRALVLILHDAAQDPSHTVEGQPQLKSCQ